MGNDNERLVGTRKVAEYLDISVRSVQNLYRTGQLRGYMVVGKLRFKPSDVEAFLQTSASQPLSIGNLEGIPTLTEKPSVASPYSLPKPSFA